LLQQIKQDNQPEKDGYQRKSLLDLQVFHIHKAAKCHVTKECTQE
jgi:hypothetical protein